VGIITGALKNLGTQCNFKTEDKVLQQCLQDQTEIGWENLLMGRISTSMTAYIDITLKQRGIEKWENSGERWSQRLLHNIWETFQSLWHNRNTIIYNELTKSKQETMREKLKLQVTHCYQHAEQLTVND
jgi:hypothetical protein